MSSCPHTCLHVMYDRILTPHHLCTCVSVLCVTIAIDREGRRAVGRVVSAAAPQPRGGCRQAHLPRHRSPPALRPRPVTSPPPARVGLQGDREAARGRPAQGTAPTETRLHGPGHHAPRVIRGAQVDVGAGRDETLELPQPSPHPHSHRPAGMPTMAWHT